MADRETEAKLIRERSALFLETARARNAREVAAFYADDGKLLAPHLPVLDGRHHVEAAWRDLLDSANLRIAWTPSLVEVASGGDLAWEMGSYALIADRSPIGRRDDRGKYVIVWRKEGGTWRVAANALNSDLPPPAA